MIVGLDEYEPARLKCRLQSTTEFFAVRRYGLKCGGQRSFFIGGYLNVMDTGTGQWVFTWFGDEYAAAVGCRRDISGRSICRWSATTRQNQAQ